MQASSISLKPQRYTARSTPLKELISQIPVRYWSMFKGIELNRTLGFTSSMTCPNLHYVMRYLGWNDSSEFGLPYERYIDSSVIEVSLNDLLHACNEVPNEYFVKLIRGEISS